MLTNLERKQIKAMLQDPKWQSIERFVNLYCDKISDDSVVRDTEWDTLKTALINHGQILGIRKLIQELYSESLKDE